MTKMLWLALALALAGPADAGRKLVPKKPADGLDALVRPPKKKPPAGRTRAITFTPVLGLDKPDVGTTGWSANWYSVMDKIEALRSEKGAFSARPSPTAKTKFYVVTDCTTSACTAGGGSITCIQRVSEALAWETMLCSAAATSVSANTVFAGATSGGSSTPAFRALVAADVPAHSAALITSGQLGAARGAAGIDLSGVAKGGLIGGTGAGTFGLSGAPGGDGKVLTSDAASATGWKWVAPGQIVVPCTGSGDHTALQAAIDAGTATGATINIPGGQTCGISTAVITKSNIQFACGAGSSFKALAGIANDTGIFRIANGQTWTNAGFDGCTFDGNNGPSVTRIHGLQAQGVISDIRITRSTFKNGKGGCAIWMVARWPYASFSETMNRVFIDSVAIIGSDSDAANDCGIRVSATDANRYPKNNQDSVLITNTQITNMGGTAIEVGPMATYGYDTGFTYLPIGAGSYQLVGTNVLGSMETYLKVHQGAVSATASGFTVGSKPSLAGSRRPIIYSAGTLAMTATGVFGLGGKNKIEAAGFFALQNSTIAGDVYQHTGSSIGDSQFTASGGGTTFAYQIAVPYADGLNIYGGGGACSTDADCNGGLGECVAATCRSSFDAWTLEFGEGCPAADIGLTRVVTTVTGRDSGGSACTPNGTTCFYNTFNWSSALPNAVTAACKFKAYRVATGGSTTGLTDSLRSWSTSTGACTYDSDCVSGRGQCLIGACVPEWVGWQVAFGATGCGALAGKKRMITSMPSATQIAWDAALGSSVPAGCEYDITGGGAVTVKSAYAQVVNNQWDFTTCGDCAVDYDELLLYNPLGTIVTDNRFNFVHKAAHPSVRIVNSTGATNTQPVDIAGGTIALQTAAGGAYGCIQIDAQGAGGFSNINIHDVNFLNPPICTPVTGWSPSYGWLDPVAAGDLYAPRYSLVFTGHARCGNGTESSKVFLGPSGCSPAGGLPHIFNTTTGRPTTYTVRRIECEIGWDRDASCTLRFTLTKGLSDTAMTVDGHPTFPAMDNTHPISFTATDGLAIRVSDDAISGFNGLFGPQATVYSGTSSSGSTMSITDANLKVNGSLPPDGSLVGDVVRITGGGGVCNTNTERAITAQTGTTLTVSAFPNSTNGCTFVVFSFKDCDDAALPELAVASSSGPTNLTFSGTTWSPNQWAGRSVCLTGTGCTALAINTCQPITANSATVLTTAAFGATPNTSCKATIQGGLESGVDTGCLLEYSIP